MFKKYKNVLFVLGILVLSFFILWIIYDKVSWTIPVNGDNATILLQADAMLHGNPTLHGWYLASDNFMTIDGVIYAVFIHIVGLAPRLMHIIPAFIYAAIMVIAIIFVSLRKTIPQKVVGSLLVLAIAGTPGFFTANETLLGPIHMGTILFVLLGYCCYYVFLRFKDRRNIGLLSLIGILVFSTLIVIGDPLSISIFVVPIIIVSLLVAYVRGNGTWKERFFSHEVYAIVGVAVGFVLGIMVHNYLITSGTHIYATAFTFVSLNQLVSNIILTVDSLLNLFGADIFGQVLINTNFIRIFIHLFLLFLVFFGLYQFLKNFKERDIAQMGAETLLEIALVIASLLNIFAYTFSTYPTDLTSSRYLTPAFFFLSIVGARYVSSFALRRKVHLVVVSLFIVLAFGALLSYIHRTSFAPTPELQVVEFLQENHLTQGYGEYWASSIITVYAKNTIQVRQLRMGDNTLVTNLWLADEKWYQKDAPKRNFVIFNEAYKGVVLPADFIDAAVNTFGQYQHAYQIGTYDIWIWDKPLPSVQ